jgi:hypothetical protein
MEEAGSVLKVNALAGQMAEDLGSKLTVADATRCGMAFAE